MPDLSQDPQLRFESGLSNDVFSSRPCPCCGSQELVENFQIQSEAPAEKRTMEEIKGTWQHFFKLTSYFTFKRCSNCGQLYCPTFFTLNQIAHLYSRMSDNTANLPTSVVGKTQRRYFDILAKFDALKGSYLEFGPDIGLLTEACINDGQFNHVTLIEPNLEVHGSLERISAHLPHKIYGDMNAYQNIPDGSLDTIAMIHVLDHLLDPTEILTSLKRKLKYGGKLLLVTHDESSMMAKVLGPRWPAYCLQHPQLYNPKSITKALNATGFQVLGIRKTYNYFPLTYLLKHLCWALKLGNVKLPNLYWLTIPLKLGNIATVATK